jgi:Mrp family chromosome partitioning ATPase
MDHKTGIALLPSGPSTTSPQNVLRSERFANAIEAWRLAYDFILIDSPPLLPISDARILAPLADYSVFVTRWGRTRWNAAMHALRLLHDAGARLAGIVVTKVDVRQLSTYEFADSETYGNGYSRYSRLRLR